MRRRLRPETLAHARHLRNEPTIVERKLWWKLRELNTQGYHFRRQVPFRSYILDFAEHGYRLVIELDGSQHGLAKHRAHDAVRDRVLSSEGYRVLRFWNDEIIDNIEGVVEGILRALTQAPHPDR